MFVDDAIDACYYLLNSLTLEMNGLMLERQKDYSITRINRSGNEGNWI